MTKKLKAFKGYKTEGLGGGLFSQEMA